MNLQGLIELLKSHKSRAYVQDLYFVISNEDTAEGRGAAKCIGAFEMWSQADEEAKGNGVHGANAEVRRQAALIIEVENARYCLDSATIHPIRNMSPAEMEAHKQKIAQGALAKLTQEEREALGLGQEMTGTRDV